MNLGSGWDYSSLRFDWRSSKQDSMIENRIQGNTIWINIKCILKIYQNGLSQIGDCCLYRSQSRMLIILFMLVIHAWSIFKHHYAIPLSIYTSIRAFEHWKHNFWSQTQNWVKNWIAEPVMKISKYTPLEGYQHNR